MSEHLETSFYILGDIIDDYIYSQIMESLDIIHGINTRTHTQGTNVINISARWNKSDFDKNIKKIQEIPNVKGIRIYKKTRHVARDLSDYVEVSDRLSWNLKKDPISEITRAKDVRDYYKALSLSCTVFGSYGKKILQLRSNRTGIKASNKTLRRLESIICLLYKQGIISNIIHRKINRVRKLRNIFEHEDRSFQYSSAQAQEAEMVITMALDCVKFIKTEYDSMINQGSI